MIGEVTAPCITPLFVETSLPSTSIDVVLSMFVKALIRDGLIALFCIVLISLFLLIESKAFARSMNNR